MHLVFVTKYRRGVFDDEMLTRCEEIMRKVCEDFEAELKEFNGERDHVHLLVHYPPKVAVSKLVNSLKGVWPGGYGWGQCGVGDRRGRRTVVAVGRRRSRKLGTDVSSGRHT
ncbi:IS200/IS605 family transposase [Streptomyces brasiliensis]|uniref:IS200/IS605 family transposase n=1 Tax=Streptomyces brasiliensis TaxID=1954 RepID=UPI003570BDFD